MISLRGIRHKMWRTRQYILAGGEIPDRWYSPRALQVRGRPRDIRGPIV